MCVCVRESERVCARACECVCVCVCVCARALEQRRGWDVSVRLHDVNNESD